MARHHPADEDPNRLLLACDVRRTKRSGPGGQNRNKVETAVVLRHRPTGVEAEASERRSQGENLRRALFRLRLNLALGVRCQADAPEAGAPAPAPSPTWQTRCRAGRLAINPEHDDFPSLLAEALDALTAHDQDPRAASEALGCSASQLVKLLKLEPRALALVNAERRARGLHALH